MNTFGQLYRVTTFGESHGGYVGCVIDGVPSNLTIDLQRVQSFLDRRRPGQSHLTSPRDEKDTVTCVAGAEARCPQPHLLTTLGSPITLLVKNENTNPGHYKDVGQVFRPSHADFTTQAKYGIRASSGGGRASARETIGRVAAAAVAEQILERHLKDFAVVAWVDSVKDIHASPVDHASITRSAVEQNAVRTGDPASAAAMEKLIADVRSQGDSVGGCITCVIRGVPAGLGAPVFDKLEADLAKAVMSLPASKGFEIGLGFRATQLLGSQHNDAFQMEGKRVRTVTNNSGGIQGGISNGETIYFRVAFKPVATVFKDQQTVTDTGVEVTFKPQAGRHDPCVLPRAVPMVEAMALLTVADHFLRHCQEPMSFS